jgi:endo-1,4-beta-mannosidase
MIKKNSHILYLGFIAAVIIITAWAGGCKNITLENTFPERLTILSKRVWSPERAWQWYKSAGVIKGCNFLPSSATNTTEMWQKETFDAKTIDSELKLASETGLNSVRVFIQYIVWKDDPEGLIERMDKFLSIAEKHDISVLWVLFDDCSFGYPAKTDPYLGFQGDPSQGEYAPFWTPSPGHTAGRDIAQLPALKKYVTDIVGHFSHDNRVLAWDIYNEAGNSGAGSTTTGLLLSSFEWVRDINPVQPVTSCQPLTDTINIYSLCDFITFHNYNTAADVESEIINLYDYGRPVISTEWLHRPQGNRVESILPIYKKYGIGWYSWGLVAGRTQTFMHWSSKPGDPTPLVWQHDLYYNDYTSYDTSEIALLRDFAFSDKLPGLLENRWSKRRATEWYERQEWPVGCNFLPSSAVNSTEMWNKDTFDPETIDKELGWAASIGFNTVRVFLQYIVWEDDPDGFKQRFSIFLDIAEKHRISVMPILFDDCFIPEPVRGKQDEPIPGVHNSRWTASPGVSMKVQGKWPLLKKYVDDIVYSYKDDDRIILWDLYNEPKDQSLSLVEETFRWVRDINPSQPITTGAYHTTYDDYASRRVLFLSDILSFHTYDQIEQTREKVILLNSFDRPVFCTEYMARPLGNTFESHLSLFAENDIAAYNWGLVAGRIQTYMPWGSEEGDSEPELWFHDIFRVDGEPYSQEEIDFILGITEENRNTK